MNKRIELAIELAYEVGKVILKYWGETKNWEKKDNTPLSEADLLADKLICQAIKKHFPNDGILSEETTDDIKQRFNKKFVWIIDPIDGTANFIRQEKDFCIMIGIVKNSYADSGVVYLPAEDKLYVGTSTYPSKLITNNKSFPLSLPQKGNDILVSKDYFDDNLNTFIQKHQLNPLHRGSAGVKACALLENQAHHYIHISDVKEWDTAASEAIYNALGGSFLNRWGKKNNYNKKKPTIEGILISENENIRNCASKFFHKLNKKNALKRKLS